MKYPSTLQIEVTENCNHDCFYCYNHWRTDNPSQNKMTIENAKRLNSILDKNIKPFGITITGGEPIMNLPVVLEISKKNIKRGFSLNSNLTVLGKKQLDILLETNNNFSILASLPHFEYGKFMEIVGKKTLPKFYKNLRNILDAGVDVTINMVTNKLNKNSVYSQGKFLYNEFGIKTFSATPALKPSMRKINEKEDYYLSNKEVVKTLEDLLKLKNDFNINVKVLEVIPPCSLPIHLQGEFENSCTAGRSTIQIGYNGDIRSCGRSPFSEGNIFKEDFEKIWKRMESYKLKKHVPEDCNECIEVNTCFGGCRFENMQQGDPMNKKDSRMVSPLKKSIKKENPINISLNKEYFIGLNAIRKEEDGYNLYSSGRTLMVNREMKEFIMSIKGGFKISGFPKKYQAKILDIAKTLMIRGFLYDKK